MCRKGFATIILCVMAMFICTSCNKSGGGILSKTPDLSRPFQSAVKIQAGELELDVTVRRYGIGIWEMTVDSPETLAGLSMTGSDSGVTASLGDLKLEVSSENVSDKAVFALIFKAIDSASSAFDAGVLTCTDTQDGKVCSGEFPSGTYTMTFDPQSLALTKIDIPEASLCAEFTEFTIISGGTENVGTTVTETTAAETSAR